jgi:hypothetical protein
MLTNGNINENICESTYEILMNDADYKRWM